MNNANVSIFMFPLLMGEKNSYSVISYQRQEIDYTQSQDIYLNTYSIDILHFLL